MKLTGHTDALYQLELTEVVVALTPDEARKLAGFLLKTASRMEEMGADYNHEHLSDQVHSFADSPHFVVVPGQDMV